MLAELRALRLGPLALLVVPGEPFVETGLALQRTFSFGQTLVVGYGESTVGYVPTPAAFREGGYEIGPGKWSFLQPTAEPILRRAAQRLLGRRPRGHPAGE